MNPIRSLSDLLQAAEQDTRLAVLETLIEESGLDDTRLEGVVSLLTHALRKRIERRKAEEPTLAFCSFCHRSQREVKVLVAAEGAGICDQCVEIAVDTIRSTGTKPTGFRLTGDG
jgi:hypothetical protein